MGQSINIPRQDGNARFNTLQVKLTENNSVTKHVVADNNGNFYYSTSGGGSGTAGTNGTSGTSGINGTSGTSGISGTNGTSGVGTNGTSGTSGTTGTSGTSGTSGINGTNGTSGTTGTSGTSGTTGTSGTSVSVSGTTNYVVKFTSATTIGNTGAMIYDNGTNVGIGTTSPSTKLYVSGYEASNWITTLNNTGSSGHQMYFGYNDGSTTRYGLYIAGGPGTGVSSFDLAVANKFYVTSGGNVGIGISSPGSIVQINDNGTGLAFTNAASGNFNIGLLAGTGSSATYIYNRANSEMIFGTNNTERMRITAAGNVGIGTTSPNGIMTVIGNTLDIRNTSGTYGTGYAIEFSTNANIPRIDLIDNGTSTGKMQSVSGEFVIQNTSNNALLFGTNNTERMRITSGGNVGIGVSGPGYKLQVSAASASNADIFLAGMTSVSNGFTIRRVSSSFAYSMIDGNVGIGTTSPLHKLQITQAVDGSYPTLGTGKGALFIAGDNNLYGLYLGVNTTSGNAYIQAMRNNSATAYDILLNPVGGNVGIGTTSPTSSLEIFSNAPSADRTLPHNVLTITAESDNAPYEGFGGGIAFKNRSYTAGILTSARVRSVIYFSGNPGQNPGAGLAFDTTPNTGSALTEAVRIRYDGNVIIGTPSLYNDYKLEVSGAIKANGNVVVDLNSTVASVLYGSGQLINGSADQPIIYLESTWNTSGNARGIEYRVTNTSSGTSSKLLNLFVDSVSIFNISKGGAITTAAPSGGTAKPFKIGAAAVVSPTSPDRTIEIEVDGTTYYLSAKTTNN